MRLIVVGAPFMGALLFLGACARRTQPERGPGVFGPPRGIPETPTDTPAPGRRPPPGDSALPDPRLPVPDAGPAIRVGIVVDRDSAIVSASGPYKMLGADGSLVATMAASSPLVIRINPSQPSRLLVRRPGGSENGGGLAPLRIVPDESSDLVSIGGRPYRGEAYAIRGTAGVTVVNHVALESYLLSVVALELGFRSAADRQAVMAQAVAARTYAVRYRGRREALGFDVFPTDADQVYGGTTAELPEVTQAVRDTEGQILTWQGQPIEALFHSTCGWSTEDSREIFQNRADAPYLRAVSDRTGDGPRDFYCSISPRFRWREEWDAAQLQAAARRALGGSGNGSTRVTDVRAARTTPTGRISQLLLVTTDGQVALNPTRIREVLRTSTGAPLNSSMFQLHVERDGENVTRVVAAGAGYGHGVGMCQYGAAGRSRAGFGYGDILRTYYHGTTLERIY